jgi:hypothetical protein
LVDLLQADVTVIAGILIFLTVAQPIAKAKETQLIQLVIKNNGRRKKWYEELREQRARDVETEML